jgi:hypothetical protein
MKVGQMKIEDWYWKLFIEWKVRKKWIMLEKMPLKKQRKWLIKVRKSMPIGGYWIICLAGDEIKNKAKDAVVDNANVSKSKLKKGAEDVRDSIGKGKDCSSKKLSICVQNGLSIFSGQKDKKYSKRCIQ